MNACPECGHDLNGHRGTFDVCAFLVGNANVDWKCLNCDCNKNPFEIYERLISDKDAEIATLESEAKGLREHNQRMLDYWKVADRDHIIQKFQDASLVQQMCIDRLKA